jgi:histidyl-tRNA synthetase
VVRAVLEHRAEIGEWPARLFYIGPMFRHERPQKGRLRQFHQFGAELFGTESPYADTEAMAFLHGFLKDAGLRDISLEINSLGDPECRPKFNDALARFLEAREAELCEDCRRRRTRNPLRVLDCKSEKCIRATADAPSILDFLCGPCRGHFAAVEASLDSSGIPFRRNPRMVRGLDYYRRTTFEFVIPGMGAQNTIAAGGRYDGLAEMIGGKEPVPAIGFALGVERLLMLLGGSAAAAPASEVFLVTASPAFLAESFRWKMELVRQGVRADMDYEGRSLKSQFRRADRSGARVVLVLGEAEAARGMVGYRDMEKGTQEEVPPDEAMQRLRGFRKEE